MIEVSRPVIAGDKISFCLDGEIRIETVVRGFWQEREKGGKEFCYETESGCIVPLSMVTATTTDVALKIANYNDLNFSEEDTSLFDIEKSVEDSRFISTEIKTIIKLLFEDDITSLGIAKTLVEHRLKKLQELFLESKQEEYKNG